MIRRWVEQANIRWGLDAQHRRQLMGVDALEATTWRFGLERMLLGYAMDAESEWQGIQPFSQSQGLDAALVGHLIRLIRALEALRLASSEPLSGPQWSI